MAGEAVRQRDHRIVRAHVAIDGDAVERLLDRGRERLLQFGLSNHGIGRDEAEHRRHVGIDHAGALGDAADAHGLPVDARFDGDFLGESIARHDGLGGAPAARAGKRRFGGGDAGFHFFDGQRHANAARGANHDLAFLEAERGRGGLGHALRVIDTHGAGAGIGVAGIGHDGPHVGRAQMRRRDAHGRGLDLVRGKSARGDGALGREDKSDIRAVSVPGFDAAIDAAREETFGGGYAAGDFFMGGHNGLSGGVARRNEKRLVAAREYDFCTKSRRGSAVLRAMPSLPASRT